MWRANNSVQLYLVVNQVPIYEGAPLRNPHFIVIAFNSLEREGAGMAQEDDYALSRHIKALPPDLWLLARAAFEELSNNPFIPILDKEEIARLICSPGFRAYLEGELKLRSQSLAYQCT